ncbi:MAG: sialidase family protein [Porticoccaceae bacterium]|nr:sialidase family protein [Porticoccaceae bacterium]MDG1473699.1 sialidase family protein [Porticoccaceae bacterium]
MISIYHRCLNVVFIVTLSLVLSACLEDVFDNQLDLSVSFPAGNNSVFPNLSLDQKGNAILSWMKTENDQVALQFTRRQNNQWGAVTTVAKGNDWLVNRADFPSVVQLTETLWAAHWLVMTDSKVFAYDVWMSLSTDDGVTWNEPFRPHTDGTDSEHGFVSFFAEGEDIGAVWLDGREMVAGHGHLSHPSPSITNNVRGMTLRSTKIKANGSLYQEQVVDGLVCDCCQTDIAQTHLGAVAVFRNRSKNEIRDIHFSLLDSGRWSRSLRVAQDDWQIAGCPVNGPSVVSINKAIGVGWYTEAKGFGEVKFALSNEDTIQFRDPIIVDQGAHVVGQIGLAADNKRGFVVSWVTSDGGDSGGLNLRYIDRQGVLGPMKRVIDVNFLRQVGLPQLVLEGDVAVMAWTGGDSDMRRVHVKMLDLSEFQSF